MRGASSIDCAGIIMSSVINLTDRRPDSAASPRWTEGATGPEARTLRRWAARVIPRRLLGAVLMLLGVTLLVVAYGRLYWAVNELQLVCIPEVDCEAAYRELHHLDIWDAIF